MSTHIGARPGDVAPLVLMPGDPLRAKWIAETFLDDARCYTEVRGMLGYTGTFEGKPVSVQASGMGCPSAAIVIEELAMLGVKTLIRVGTCGGLSGIGLRLADTVIALSATCEDQTPLRYADCPGWAPAATLKRMYHWAPSIMRMTEPHWRLPPMTRISLAPHLWISSWFGFGR